MTAKTEGKQHEAHPPKPPVIFRVGFTGHRPKDMPKRKHEREEIQSTLTGVLNQMAAVAYAEAPKGCPVHLRLTTQLAEGADRLAAFAANDAAFELDAILPFPKETYVHDFEEEGSIPEFHELLQHCRNKTELHNTGKPRDKAYEISGNLLVQQCDLLLAVWNEGESGGPGGTADMMDVALRRGLPVMAVSTHRRGMVHVVKRGVDGPELDLEADTAAFVTETIPAAIKLSRHHPYWEERWPRFVPAFAYCLVRFMAHGEFKWLSLPDQHAAVTEVRLECLQKHFRWLDALAQYYGEVSRSLVMFFQLAALILVLCSLAANVTEPLHRGRFFAATTIVFELAAITVIFFLNWWSQKKQWHEKWLTYRCLAEQVRCMDILLPLGMDLPRLSYNMVAELQHPHAVFQTGFRTAIARQQGMPNDKLNHPFVKNELDYLLHFSIGQWRHHKVTAERYRAAGRFLSWFRWATVTGVLIAVFIHGISAKHEAKPSAASHADTWTFHMAEELTEEKHRATILLVAGILTAVGVTSSSLAASAEFKRLAHRSASMEQTLGQLVHEMKKQREEASRNGKDVPLPRAMEWAQDVAEAVSYEVRDWQVMISGKPPEGEAA